jgi:drug/metabolite transporter (DMT)-like permease
MALGAGAVWSFGAIVARLADGADAFQYLIWRSVGVIIVIEVFGLYKRKPMSTIRAFVSGPMMMLANLMLLLASIGFIYAVKTTTPANAAFLGSTTPVFGVIMARVFLHERLTGITVATIGVAFGGLAIMVAGDLSAGNTVGNLCALSAAVGFAGYTVVVRSNPNEDWSPVLPGYAVLMIILCGVITVSHGKTLLPPAVDIGYALLHGGLFIVFGTILFNAASRQIPAAAMTVFAQTEMVLVPVWAFIVWSDRPKATTLIGGSIIFAAIMTKAIIDARHPGLQPSPVMEPVL